MTAAAGTVSVRSVPPRPTSAVGSHVQLAPPAAAPMAVAMALPINATLLGTAAPRTAPASSAVRMAAGRVARAGVAPTRCRSATSRPDSASVIPAGQRTVPPAAVTTTISARRVPASRSVIRRRGDPAAQAVAMQRTSAGQAARMRPVALTAKSVAIRQFDDLRCEQGTCVCTAQSCPDGCCTNGPGNPGACIVAGDRNNQCGINGEACNACPTGQICSAQGQCLCTPEGGCSFGTSCNAQGQCECTNESCPPSTGSTCQNNLCICTDGVCDGCCQDGRCKPGNTPDACAPGGDCAVCAAGEICLDRQCCAVDCDGTCCPPGSKCCGGTCCPSDTPFCNGGTCGPVGTPSVWWVSGSVSKD